MALSIETGKKLSNAGWSAKARIDPSGHVQMNESSEDLPGVEVFWYPNGEIKFVIKDAGPLAVDQFYRSSDQTIVKLFERP